MIEVFLVSKDANKRDEIFKSLLQEEGLSSDTLTRGEYGIDFTVLTSEHGKICVFNVSDDESKFKGAKVSYLSYLQTANLIISFDSTIGEDILKSGKSIYFYTPKSGVTFSQYIRNIASEIFSEKQEAKMTAEDICLESKTHVKAKATSSTNEPLSGLEQKTKPEQKKDEKKDKGGIGFFDKMKSEVLKKIHTTSNPISKKNNPNMGSIN